MKTHHKPLQVQDDLCDVFLHTGDRRKLMLHAFDAHAGHSGARQGRKQHTPQGVAQCLAKTALQRIDNILSVVFAGFDSFDLRLFELGHAHLGNPPSQTVG